MNIDNVLRLAMERRASDLHLEVRIVSHLQMQVGGAALHR